MKAKQRDEMKHLTTETTRDINAMARSLAKARRKTLAEFASEVLTREIQRMWNNQPPEDNSAIRTIVREEIARTFG